MQEIFGAPSLVAVLRVLNQITQAISGRELARRSGMNDRTCRLALKRLETLNVIEKIGSGKTILFKLNRKNYFTKSILGSLFNKEKNYLNAIIAELQHQLQPNSKWSCVYGSVAKQKDTVSSDFDILIIVDNEMMVEKLENKIPQLISLMYTKFGIALSPLILSYNQWDADNQFQELKSDVQKHHIQISGTKC